MMSWLMMLIGRAKSMNPRGKRAERPKNRWLRCDQRDTASHAAGDRVGARGVIARRLALLLAVMALSVTVQAQQDYDCTDFDPVFDDLDIPLTDAERSALRDAELLGTLNRIDRCQSEGTAGGGGGGGDGQGTGGGAGSGNGSGNGSGAAGAASPVAATGVRGTEAIAAPATATAGTTAEATAASTADPAQPPPAETSFSTDAAVTGGQTVRPPDDIPPVDNDDAVARQIRKAAEAETDPERRAALWNDYRRYTGLPVSND
jgi:hypothetical protein